MKRISIVVVTLLLAATGTSRVQAYDDYQPDEEFKACLDVALASNLAAGACGIDLEGRENSRLAEIEKDLLSLVTPKFKEAFAQEHAAWTAYKETSCGFYLTNKVDNAFSALEYRFCRARIVSSRAVELGEIVTKLRVSQ